MYTDSFSFCWFSSSIFSRIMHLPLFWLRLSAVVTGGRRAQRVSNRGGRLLTRKLVVKVDQLAIVDLLQQSLKLLRLLAALAFLDAPNGIKNVLDVLGDGKLVTGLRYKDRNTEQEHDLDLAGVFIQIGLVKTNSNILFSI